MTDLDPLLDSLQLIPANLVNLKTAAPTVRYVSSAAATSTSTSYAVLPAGTGMAFLKRYEATSLRFDISLEYQLTVAAFAGIELGMRFTNITSTVSDQLLARGLSSVVSQQDVVSGVRIITPSSVTIPPGPLMLQPIWRVMAGSTASAQIEFNSGYAFSLAVREVYPQ